MAHFYSWFPGDYQRDTTHLSFVEDAAYRRLLDAYYMRGVIEANASGLLRVARAISPDEQAAVIKVAAEFFEERDGRLHHAKVEHEMARSLAVSAARSEAGKIGVAAKRAKRAKLAAIAEANALTNAEANASDLLSKTQANRKQPIPTVYTEGKPSVTAAPSSPDPKKAIFDLGVSILTKTGTTEGGARSFLAKYAKQDEGKLAEVLGHLAANAKVEPKAYIAAAFKPEARGLVI